STTGSAHQVQSIRRWKGIRVQSRSTARFRSDRPSDRTRFAPCADCKGTAAAWRNRPGRETSRRSAKKAVLRPLRHWGVKAGRADFLEEHNWPTEQRSRYQRTIVAGAAWSDRRRRCKRKILRSRRALFPGNKEPVILKPRLLP